MNEKELLTKTKLGLGQVLLLVSIFASGVSIIATFGVIWFGGRIKILEPSQAPPRLDYQEGWPQYTGDMGMGNPIYGNFDPNYPGQEVIVGTTHIDWGPPIAYEGRIFVWHEDGTPVPNWSPKIIDEPIHITSISLADVDSNGNLEIVVATNPPVPPNGQESKLYVLNLNGEDLPGWPQNVGSEGVTSYPVVKNLDSESNPEIIVASKDNKLYIFNHDGTPLNNNWPKTFPTDLYRTPTVANLDSDSDMELLVGTFIGDYKLYALNIDGTNLNSHWPLDLSPYFAFTPIVADLNQDGQLEIIFGAGQNTSQSRIYAIDLDTNPLSPIWPIDIKSYPFQTAVADIDPSFTGLEIITSTRYSNQVYAYHYDGTEVSNWPYIASGESYLEQPVMADINNDGQTEIIFSSRAGNQSKLYIVDADGDDFGNWPLDLGKGAQISPAVGDIDDDGIAEIIQPLMDGWVYIFEVGNVGDIDWPLLHYNRCHNSLIGEKCTGSAIIKKLAPPQK